MSDIITALRRGRVVAWPTLVPAFDHALVLAEEAEHASEVASMQVLSNIPPNYPPLVKLLAESAPSAAIAASVEALRNP